MNSQPQCQSGSVVVASSTTTESPFVLDQGCIRYKNKTVIVEFNETWHGPVISYHDQIEIVKALNAAYQWGYTAGFNAPKFI